MSKVSKVLQGATESPAAFLGRLLKAYQTYTPIDPEAPENRRAICLAFVSQSAPDKRRKLQKIRGVAKGVLAQSLGPWKRPVAYLSKRLDPMADGWPTCLRAIATTALLIKKANKLTFRRNLTIVAPHHVEGLLLSPPDRWLSNARITQYQVLLLDQTQVTFSKTTALNPATLVPEPGGAESQYDCYEILEALTSLRADLTDIPLKQPDWTLFQTGAALSKKESAMLEQQ